MIARRTRVKAFLVTPARYTLPVDLNELPDRSA
jgi:hypothetical protein